MIILDTNVISEMQRPTPNPNVVAWLNAQDPTNLYLTAVTVGELLFGAHVLPPGKRQKALSDSVAAIVENDFDGRVLPYDATAAYFYGMRIAAAKRSGVSIGVADGQIAAISFAQNIVPVATRDRKPFDMLNVDVIDPWAYPN